MAPGHPVLAPHQLQPAHRGRSSSTTSSRGWVRSGSCRGATTASSSTSTTVTGGGARSPTADLDRVALGRRGLPDRARGHGHDPQLPHGARLRGRTARDRRRPLLLNTYTAADAFAYTPLVRGSAHGEELIRGREARWARHDPRPCQVGPGAYRPIFEAQQG